jgi:hypothetical protein
LIRESWRHEVVLFCGWLGWKQYYGQCGHQDFRLVSRLQGQRHHEFFDMTSQPATTASFRILARKLNTCRAAAGLAHHADRSRNLAQYRRALYGCEAPCVRTTKSSSPNQ